MTLTGTSSLTTLWNRIAVANRPSKSHLLRTWSSSQTLAYRKMKEYWRRSREIELNKGNYWAVIVRTENKDPGNLFMAFILFIVIFQSSKLERARKGTDTIHSLHLFFFPFLSWYSKTSKMGGTVKKHEGPLPRNIFLSHPPLPPKIAIVNDKRKYRTRNQIRSFLSFLNYWQTWSRIYSSVNCTYLTTLNVLPLRLFWYKQVEVYKFELPPASSVR